MDNISDYQIVPTRMLQISEVLLYTHSHIPIVYTFIFNSLGHNSVFAVLLYTYEQGNKTTYS